MPSQIVERAQPAEVELRFGLHQIKRGNQALLTTSPPPYRGKLRATECKLGDQRINAALAPPSQEQLVRSLSRRKRFRGAGVVQAQLSQIQREHRSMPTIPINRLGCRQSGLRFIFCRGDIPALKGDAVRLIVIWD
jgi:hypothetical protein